MALSPILVIIPELRLPSRAAGPYLWLFCSTDRGSRLIFGAALPRNAESVSSSHRSLATNANSSLNRPRSGLPEPSQLLPGEVDASGVLHVFGICSLRVLLEESHRRRSRR